MEPVFYYAFGKTFSKISSSVVCRDFFVAIFISLPKFTYFKQAIIYEKSILKIFPKFYNDKK